MQLYYCEACGLRVSDAQIERGECRKVGDTVWCAKCLDKAPAAPPPRPASQTRSVTPHATRATAALRGRPASSSQASAVPRARPTGVAHAPVARTLERAHLPAKSLDPKVATFLIAAGLGTVISASLVIIVVKSREVTPAAPRSTSTAVPRPEPAPAVPPVRQPAPPVVPVAPTPAAGAGNTTAAGTGTSRVDFARIALESAEQWARENPNDIAGQIRRFESIATNHPSSAAAEDARRRARRLRDAHPEVAAALTDQPAVARIPKPPPRPAPDAPVAVPDARDPLFDCLPLARRVTVDGRLDDWVSLPFEVKEPALIKITPEQWTGPEDSWFRFGIGYDERYVYVGLEVFDDLPCFQTGVWPWSQDGVEIRFDGRPDPERSEGVGKNEFVDLMVISMSPGANGEPITYYQKDKWPPDTLTACVTTATGHITEVALPHAYLDEKQGRPWEYLRFNIAVDDYDGEPKDGKTAAQIWFRPDWRVPGKNYPGSGTFARVMPLPRLAPAPAVDGSLDEWPARAVSGALLGTITRQDQFCNGDLAKWTGPDDMSARVYAGWCDGALYMAVAVVDDVYVPSTDNKAPWEYDCVEFFIDGRERAQQDDRALTPGCYQIAISPTELRLVPPPTAIVAKTPLTGLTTKALRVEGGYVVEAKLELTADNFPAGGWVPGRRFSFSVIVNDKDDPAGQRRDYCFGWSCSEAGSNWKNTSGWKRMVLKD